jgi:hypothetical protein
VTLRSLSILLLLSSDISAQTTPRLHASTGSLTADVLRDLPNGGNLFAVLETVQPEIIADGFHSGGLNGGTPASLGAFLASPRQTRYRLGDLDLSSPIDGTPLLFPQLAPWDRVDVTTGLTPIDRNAPGLVVDLWPLTSTARWRGLVEASAASGVLITDPSTQRPPPITQLTGWTNATVAFDGPLVADRLRLAIGAAWLRSATRQRNAPFERETELGSLFAQTLARLQSGTNLRTVVWVQRSESIAPGNAVHLQSTLERTPSDQNARLHWRFAGGYTRRHDNGETFENVLDVDRLTDGPFTQWLPSSAQTQHRASIAAHASAPVARRHQVAWGGLGEHVGSTQGPGFLGLIAESVDSVPARVWSVTSPPFDSRRTATSLLAYVEDRMSVSPRVTLHAGLAFDWVSGKADGAVSEIQWATWLPRLTVDWNVGSRYDVTFFTGYRRAANNLRLDVLAYGDPSAAVANVHRWDGSQISAAGQLIARVGPGTGGEDSFSRIDRQLKRPLTDEFVIGLDARPRSSLRLSVAGIARRQSSLVHVVNTGVSLADYESFTIPDDNVDIVGTEDDQQLEVFNRIPSSFGRDRYFVTNPAVDAATMGAFVIAAEATTDRLWLRVGATASATVGSGGARGFRAVENDQDVLGELFVTPNAQSFARGRLFLDRAYVIKWTTIYRFPAAFTLGAIARYQDGQPFSRMVVVTDLNQGPEAIQAFANGRSRFAFTGTLDLRVQKGFALAGRRVDVILDAYNVLNMSKEVEEYVVTGSRYRATTYVQPPPVFHLGLRLRL